eukprot:CAMPEP_0174244410 /NCGR_PEP_ID=MMETSP0417-20130205/35202_1 /TAXON_ID=242541 /ORGANISM="Mayorella sp, Strain BSH-02190019" /LENGTH=44 /DNA_ID= /DNA_START= /DNA_END= /DNA_ORIENTATION=
MATGTKEQEEDMTETEEEEEAGVWSAVQRPASDPADGSSQKWIR